MWDNPEDQFVLRFNDLNQLKQNKLAQRLKETSQRQRVRSSTGPTIEEIVSLLKEINPIIHTEGLKRQEHGQWRRWNCTNVQTLSGWYYRKLDQLIYKFLCLNRPPHHHEIKDALLLSTQNVINHSLTLSRRMIEIMMSHLSPENNETPANSVPAEIGINEIQSARERTERRNN